MRALLAAAALALGAARASAFQTSPRSERLCDPSLPAAITVTWDVVRSSDAAADAALDARVEQAAFEGMNRAAWKDLSPCAGISTAAPSGFTTRVTATARPAEGGLTYVRVDSWSDGGAHPSGSIQAFYAAKDGRALGAKELFTPRGLLRVDALVRADLARRYPDGECGADFTTLAKQGSLEFTARSLKILFSEEEIAPHVCGFPEVELPLAKVRAALRPGSPFSRKS